MRRFVLAAVVAVLTAVAGVGLVAPPEDADALPTGTVLGVYQVRLRGSGWSARPSPSSVSDVASKVERVAGNARIEIVARDPEVNDGLVTVRVLLDGRSAQSVLGDATPKSPAFEATAALAGDAFSAIDAGQPNYVNALTLRFDRRGRKVQGDWMAVFPSLEPDLATQKFATGVSVSFVGRRVPGAVPEASPVEAVTLR